MKSRWLTDNWKKAMRLSISIGILLFVVLTYGVYAQQIDSTRLLYSQEIDSLPPKPENRLTKTVYRRFIRAQVEEKTLIKVGMLPTSAGFGADGYTIWGFKSEVGVERKLTPALSVLFAGRAQYRRINSSFPGTTVFNGVLAGRWYYNMPKRIRQRKSANNFSDQYLTLEINQLIRPQTTSSTLIPVYPRSGPLVRMAFGAQRRLGHLMYLDASIGASYLRNRPRPFDTSLTFMIGLGF